MVGLYLEYKNCPRCQGAVLPLVGFSQAETGRTGLGQGHDPAHLAMVLVCSVLLLALPSLLSPASVSDVLPPAQKKPLSTFFEKLQ